MNQQVGIVSPRTRQAHLHTESQTPVLHSKPANRADEIRSANHFDEGARTYAAAYNDRASYGHSFRARRSTAKELLGGGNLGDLLDVGGASGVYFDALKSQVKSYHILDVSPLMISEAQKIKSETVPLFCHLASAYDLPFPNHQFDTVLAMGVLEYLDQPWKALEEMARVTKPGGVIVVSYPNAQSPMRRMTQFLYKKFHKGDPFAGSLLFSVDEVGKATAPLKLKEVRIRGYNAQLIPFPFTWRLRRFSYYLAEFLEPLLGRFGNLWGSSFNIKYEKLSE